MPFGRRRPVDRLVAEPVQRTVGAVLKRWTIPIIGAVTPTALIVVNISMFIAHHTAEFRLAIASLAFVSGLMLNSWAGLSIYRTLQQRRPDHALLHEHNREIVLVVGMAVIIAAAFLTAFFCYVGLADYNKLPNWLTFFTGVFAAAVPILVRAAFQRGPRRDQGRDRPQATTVAGLPPSRSP